MIFTKQVWKNSYTRQFGARHSSLSARVCAYDDSVKKAADRILRGPELTAATAEKVFGWKDVHQHNGELVGKKQDKAGRWRSAKVPDYASDPVHGYAIDQRMKQIGSWERYIEELTRITKATNLPREWATPEQRSSAAVNVLRKARRWGNSNEDGEF